MTLTLVLALCHIGGAFIVSMISIPLVKGKIPPNQTHGIRIRQAFESDENWYAINRYGGKAMILWSIPIFLVGVFLLVLSFVAPIDPSNWPLLILFCITAALHLGAVVQTVRWAKRHYA